MKMETEEIFRHYSPQEAEREHHFAENRQNEKYGKPVFTMPEKEEKTTLMTAIREIVSNFRFRMPSIHYVKTSVLLFIITSFTFFYSGDNKAHKQTLSVENVFAQEEEKKEITDEEREKQREIEQAVKFYKEKEKGEVEVIKNLKLLNELKERQKSLEEKEMELKNKESQIKTIESSIDTKLADMQTLKNQLEELITMRKDLGEKNIKQLVKVYESMKPAEAAIVIEKLEEDIAVQVLKRMLGKKAGKILDVMNPAKTVRLSGEIARINPPEKEE
ncbi:MAG: hypothetical protein HQK84_04300 [Nitrospinae bacterium]|nr:hypothetical protein [Nitrospinota bacterium]